MEVAQRVLVLVIGDIILEHYLYGTVSQVSSDAPVPIVEQNNIDGSPGGAANIALNLAALRVGVKLVGVIGTDNQGEIILRKLNESGVDISGVLVVGDRHTTLKTHIFGNDQQLLTIDRAVTSPLSEPMQHELSEFVQRYVNEVDSIVLSDYGRCVFNSTLAETVIAMARVANKRVIVDFKGTANVDQYVGTTVFTSDLQTFRQATKDFPPKRITLIDSILRYVQREKNLGSLVLTRGADKLTIYEEVWKTDVPMIHHIVKDHRGASDNFLAALVWGLLRGHTLGQAAQIGNLARGFALSRPGILRLRPEDMQAGLEDAREWRSKFRTTTSDKILDSTCLREKIWWVKSARKRIVFTNGCFELLHGCHIELLQKAKSFGDRLIVGVKSDASIQQLKGPGRPLVGENMRAQLLSALACVDHVVLFNEDSLLNLIQIIRPNVLVSAGADHGADVVGRETVEAEGGRVEVIAMTEELSTTALVDSIIVRHQSKLDEL